MDVEQWLAPLLQQSCGGILKGLFPWLPPSSFGVNLCPWQGFAKQNNEQLDPAPRLSSCRREERAGQACIDLIRKRGFTVAVKGIRGRKVCRVGPGEQWDTAGTL